jgi:hypothetical protein
MTNRIRHLDNLALLNWAIYLDFLLPSIARFTKRTQRVNPGSLPPLVWRAGIQDFIFCKTNPNIRISRLKTRITKKQSQIANCAAKHLAN